MQQVTIWPSKLVTNGSVCRASVLWLSHFNTHLFLLLRVACMHRPFADCCLFSLYSPQTAHRLLFFSLFHFLLSFLLFYFCLFGFGGHTQQCSGTISSFMLSPVHMCVVYEIKLGQPYAKQALYYFSGPLCLF